MSYAAGYLTGITRADSSGGNNQPEQKHAGALCQVETLQAMLRATTELYFAAISHQTLAL